MIDWLNDNSGAVQAIAVVVLAIVTGVYAWRTWTISSATEKQAEAGVRMAEEMREQRMAEDEPWLVLDFASQKLADYHEWDEHDNILRHKVTGEEIVPWPLPDCTIRVHNDGRRAAINIEVSYLQADDHYVHSARRSLIHGRTCTVEVSGFPAPYGGRAAWQEQLLQRLKAGGPGCIIARYEDVHGRMWVSYLDLDWHEAMVPYIVPLSQGRVLLSEKAVS